MRKCYCSFDNARKSEKVLRNFLLKNSDMVRFTEVHWTELSLLKIVRHGGEKDSRFVQAIANLQSDFVKKIANNKRFNDLSQGNKKFTHYFSNLQRI